MKLMKKFHSLYWRAVYAALTIGAVAIVAAAPLDWD
jgi:hypothetical protein